MDDILADDRVVHMDYITQNPEAIFDFITMQTMQEKYADIGLHHSTKSVSHNGFPATEPLYQNEADFEIFVQQFPIDDSIAECFAFTSDSKTGEQESKFITGAKRPQTSSKYHKFKKRLGLMLSDDISVLEDDVIPDSKRSKKGGVFSKRHKWLGANNKVSNYSGHSVTFSDHSDADNVFNAIDSEISRDCQSADNCETSRTDSCSASDSQITSFSGILTQQTDQGVPGEFADSDSNSTSVYCVQSLDRKQHWSGNEHRHCDDAACETMETEDYIESIFHGDTSDMINMIEEISSERAMKLRDHWGNTLLHRCVLHGNADVLKFMLDTYPDMISDMNMENETAIELATKHGKYECLKVMLDRNKKLRCLGSSLVNRLILIAAQHGQAECLSLLLSHLSHDPQTSWSLPGDTRGNTAAHFAAKHGHLSCLQTLVSSGFNVTSENLLGQRPLHIAHQNRSYSCFEYLLLLNICEELLQSFRTYTHVNPRVKDITNHVKPDLEQIKILITRYEELCRQTSYSLVECKTSIMQALNELHENLELFLRHTTVDSATKRNEAREKLAELSGEIQRLEDTFEFSPLADTEAMLGKMLKSLNDVIEADGDAQQKQCVMDTTSKESINAQLCSIIKDIHKEFMLENWDTKHIYAKHIGIQNDLTKIKPSLFSDETSMCQKQENQNTKHSVVVVDADIISDPQKASTVKEVTLVENDTKCFQNNYDKSINYKDSAAQNTSFEGMRPKEYSLKHSDEGGDMNSKDITTKTNHITKTCAALIKQDLQPDYVSAECGRKENRDMVEPTERPFTKLLTLDERIDILIAGERARINDLYQDKNVTSSESSREIGTDVNGSLYASTFTSITSDTSSSSEWYSKLGLHSLESSNEEQGGATTDSASYWWDADHNEEDDVDNCKVSHPYRDEIRRHIQLNLENEDSSFEELRKHRLLSHLHSLQHSRLTSENYRECITTSTGEVMGGFHNSLSDIDKKIVVNVNGTMQRRRADDKPVPTPRKKDKPKLYTLEDAIATKPLSEEEFRERFDRSRDRSLGSDHMTFNTKWTKMTTA